MPNLVDWIARIGEVEVARPLTLGATLWMTYQAYQWAGSFAALSLMSGTDTAMVIAAVIAPVSVLQGYVFKAYVSKA